jgi:glucose-6-phosphate isomerase, archaeal
MDVARRSDHEALQSRMLLFGVVAYARGRLGEEPVRSQGHVHCVSSHSGWSPPELYEIWSGRAVILMQEHPADNPGRVYAVEAGTGEKVLVPPGWAHATISADRHRPLFGALCDREFGFEYEQLRKRRGLAWYPLAISQHALDLGTQLSPLLCCAQTESARRLLRIWHKRARVAIPAGDARSGSLSMDFERRHGRESVD